MIGMELMEKDMNQSSNWEIREELETNCGGIWSFPLNGFHKFVSVIRFDPIISFPSQRYFCKSSFPDAFLIHNPSSQLERPIKNFVKETGKELAEKESKN